MMSLLFQLMNNRVACFLKKQEWILIKRQMLNKIWICPDMEGVRGVEEDMIDH